MLSFGLKATTVKSNTLKLKLGKSQHLAPLNKLTSLCKKYCGSSWLIIDLALKHDFFEHIQHLIFCRTSNKTAAQGLHACSIKLQ